MELAGSIRASQKIICKRLSIDNAVSSHAVKKKRKRCRRGLTTMNRKEKRRFAKQMQKARRIAHSTKTPLSDLYSKVRKARGKKVDFVEVIRPKESAQMPVEGANQEEAYVSPKTDESEDVGIEHHEKNVEKSKLAGKVRHLRELIEEDGKEINKYAKKLKLHKRKNNSLPKSFEEDGLAYLLDFCDKKRRTDVLRGNLSEEEFTENINECVEGDLSSEDSDEDAPEELPVFSKRAKRRKANDSKVESIDESTGKKRVRFEFNKKFDEDAELSDKERFKANETSEVASEENQTEQDALTEDIYGRLRDRKGNIVEQTQKTIGADSITPNKESDKTAQMLAKNFRSLVNRLSEANIQMSANKVTELYGKYGRTSVKSCLTTALFNSLIKPEKVPDRLILEHCLLLAMLHNRLSMEITAYFVEELASKLKIFAKDLSAETISAMDKTTDNVCLIFGYLFLLKVLHVKLLFDILKLLSEHLNEKTIELLLIVLQSIGFNLRKEAPLELKVFIEDVNVKASNVDANRVADQSRMRFMLDTLQSVKNNNALKVSHCDLELNDHFLKLLRGFFAGKQLESPLPMTLQDLWSAPVNGRWWIVGSAVTVTRPSNRHNDIANVPLSSPKGVKSTEAGSPDFSEKLMRLAQKNHMNTDLRRNIFCIIISSEDYLDAFEKLCRLSLKGHQEREIIHIAIMCCLKEKTYNPYYTYLVQRFCQHQPRFVLTTQFAIWDKAKLLSDLPLFSVRNLGLFVGQTLSNRTLPLSILKVIDFGAIDKRTETFCSFLFEKLLCESSEEVLNNIFADCLSDRHKEKYEALVEGIKTFFNYFLLRDKRLMASEQYKIVKSRICALEKFLYYHVGSSLL